MQNSQRSINSVQKPYSVNLADFFFVTFIYTSIILPSGALFGINVKLLSLFLFMFSIILVGKSYLLSSLIKVMMPVAVFLVFEVLYSYIVFRFDNSYILAQAKDIFVFFLMFNICLAYGKYIKNYDYVADKIIKAVFYVGLIKVLIIVYSFFSGIPVSFLTMQIGDFFGVSIMSFDVENSAISRINFTSDSILAICIFYLLMKAFRKKITLNDGFIILVIGFSALITMSRFQWAACILSMFAAIFLNLRIKKSFFVLLFLAIISFATLSFQSTQELISTRFDQRIISSSDIERYVQKQKILQEIDEAPILGNGLGYYIPDVIRSTDAKYSYELQLPALVMQLGMVGFLIIMFMIVFPLFSPLLVSSFVTKVFFILMIIVWLAGAMFNPILFSSSAGITMAFFNIISRLSWINNR